MWIFIQMTTFHMPLALPLIWSFNIFWLFLMHFIILQQQAIMQTIGDLVATTTIIRFWMKHALCKQFHLATASNLQQPCATLQGNWKFLDRLLVTRPVRLSQLCVTSIFRVPMIILHHMIFTLRKNHHAIKKTLAPKTPYVSPFKGLKISVLCAVQVYFR